MRFRKTILVGLAVAEVLAIGYSAVSIALSFDQKELGWGGYKSFDIPVMPLIFALVLGICFVWLLSASEIQTRYYLEN